MNINISEFVNAMLRSAFAAEPDGLIALAFTFSAMAGLWSALYQLRIRSWPSVRGELLGADIKNFGPANISPSKTEYKIAVEYRYRVANKQYTGNRFSPWLIITSKNFNRLLQQQLSSLPDESPFVEVIYKPSNPAKSFLKRPGYFGVLLTLAASLMMLLAAVKIFA